MTHRRFTVTVLTAALVVTGAISAAGSGGQEPTTTGQELAIPSYFYPAGDGLELWDQMTAAADGVGIVVANPSSGPGTVRDESYADAMSDANDAGITVLGYVATGYLGTTGRATRLGQTTPEAWFAQVQHEVARWYELYGDDGLGGIFFDEVQNVCGPGGLYADTYRAIDAETKRLHRVDGEHVPFTVINPGIDTESCYADIGDVILTIEETYEAYVGWTPPAWHRTVDPRRLWHLVHTTPTEGQMVHAMALAKERNAGYVYVTPDVLANPWDTLPPPGYWERELAEAGPGGRPDTVVPTAPGRPIVTRRGSIDLSVVWPAAHDRGGRVVGYDVYLDGVRVTGTGRVTPRATITGLEPSTTYEVSVRARDRAGNESEVGPPARVTTAPADGDAPVPPAGFTAVDVRVSSAVLHWTASPEPDVVTYEVSIAGSTVMSLPAWLYTGDPVTVPISGLEPGSTYAIAVRARDAGGNRSEPASLTLTTPEPSGEPISDAAGSIDGDVVTYQAQFNRPFDFHHVFIDLDSDESTGFATVGIGADLLIENFWFYRHVGEGWSWAPIPFDPLVSFEDGHYVWRVPVSVLEDAFGGPVGPHRAVFRGGGTSPEAFSDIVVVE